MAELSREGNGYGGLGQIRSSPGWFHPVRHPESPSMLPDGRAIAGETGRRILRDGLVFL
jgi:hypothetical protein